MWRGETDGSHALVFNAIQGPDGFDRATKDVPFNWNATMPLSKLLIAYFEPQALLGGELEHDRRDEGLRDAADAEPVLGPKLPKVCHERLVGISLERILDQ